MRPSRMPTPKECSDNSMIEREGDNGAWYAIWYPQIGGYVGRAAVHLFDSVNPGDCFDVALWHDGEFSTDDDADVMQLHHCSPGQFVEFGALVTDLQGLKQHVVRGNDCCTVFGDTRLAWSFVHGMWAAKDDMWEARAYAADPDLSGGDYRWRVTNVTSDSCMEAEGSESGLYEALARATRVLWAMQ